MIGAQRIRPGGTAQPPAQDPKARNLRQNMPSAAFINASGNALAGPQGKKNLRDNVRSLLIDHNVNTLYVPILTSDGRDGTSGNNSRDRKYEDARTQREWFGLFGQEKTVREPRDVLNETRDIATGAGRKPGKNQNDLKVVPWVESAFTTYVGRNQPQTGNLRDPKQVPGFTANMESAILRGRDGKPIEMGNEDGKKPGGGSGNAYLDPLNPKVQQNVRQMLLNTARRGDVPAIMIDDHFGIPLDKPEVRAAVLNSHPVSDKYRQEKAQEIANRLRLNVNSKAVQDEVENSWLRHNFTQFVSQVKADLKGQGVQLWASTNMPDAARRQQGQDIENWVRDGLVDNWNVQLYRQDQNIFQRDFNSLQQRASQIPQVQNGQVPLSVAVSTYANGAQLSPEEMAQRINYAKDPKNQKVNTTTAAFDGGGWLQRVQEQEQPGRTGK
jgi:hypothetical protein